MHSNSATAASNSATAAATSETNAANSLAQHLVQVEQIVLLQQLLQLHLQQQQLLLHCLTSGITPGTKTGSGSMAIGSGS